MGNRSMFVGLNVHKETIDIAVADGGRQGEVRHYGTIAGDLEALGKVIRTLRTPNTRRSHDGLVQSSSRRLGDQVENPRGR